MMSKVSIVLGLFFFFACQPTVPKAQSSSQQNIQVKEASGQKVISVKDINKDKYLCKVNGEEWYYSGASAIIQKASTRHAYVAITFQFDDHPDKSLQLNFDYETMELYGALLHPIEKMPDGSTGFLVTSIDLASLEGTIEIIPTGEGERKGARGKVSGTASFKAAHDRFGDYNYEVTELIFDNVNYSNLYEFNIAGMPR